MIVSLKRINQILGAIGFVLVLHRPAGESGHKLELMRFKRFQERCQTQARQA